MQVNKEELFSVYKQIKTEPQTWNQRNWAINWDLMRDLDLAVATDACGTAYCFAGHVVRRAGYNFVFARGRVTTDTAMDEQGDVVLIADKARQILGLSYDAADELFSASNGLGDIRAIITNLTGEDPEA